jgi:hypothetical protein
MKRLAELTPSDLERVHVWKYEGETDETAAIRATDRTELSSDEDAVFIARTQFKLANGAQHVGFCSPSEETDVDHLRPVILTAAGPVHFWFDDPPTAEFLRAQWARLGIGQESIFPIHFRCTVPVRGRYIVGTIEEDDLTGAA